MTFKTQTWTDLPSLPEWLQGASAAIYDGKVVVEGATMYVEFPDRPTVKFPDGEVAEERVYVYDPAAQAWSQASSEGMYLGQTIVNDEGQLKLVGSALPMDPETYMTNPAPIMKYDLATGAGDVVCNLPVEENESLRRMGNALAANPQVVAKAGVICIYSDYLYSNKLDPYVMGGVDTILVEGDQVTALADAVPELFLATEGEPLDNGGWDKSRMIPYRAVLAVSTDGFVLVGPPAADGSSDTFVLPDGGDRFEPYEKRASESRVFSQAACSYRGRLFVIGTSWFESDQRLFRATAMDVPEYPGDIPCEEPEPEPKPEPKPEPEPVNPPAPKPPLPATGDVTGFGFMMLLASLGLAFLFLGRAARRSC